ncbi:MAG TPA: hypothetical protein VF834_07925 [Streptosporangiaceae bacterium]
MAMADIKKQGRSWIVSAALIAAGAVVGYNLPQHAASPMSDVGTVTKVSPALGSQTAITFQPKKGSIQHFTVYGPATPWRAAKSGGWNYSSSPPCLTPGSAGQGKVTLGVIDVQEGTDSPRGGPIVAWVACYG